jgi:serine/threonine-protein kinase
VLDDDVDDDGTTFLVLELLVGKTLEDERESQGGKLPPIQLLHIVREVLNVLAVVHEAGIVHRDVKPENIFLLDTGPVKLLDLGIARFGTTHLTTFGQALGTPSFMAPEQARGRLEEVDARTDIFGVGAILFTLLSGRPVHEGPTPGARLQKAATEQARSLFDVMPDAKGALANLVDVALRFDKSQRWSSAADMNRAVKEVLTLILPRAAAPAPAPVPVPERVIPAAAKTGKGWPSPWSDGKRKKKG